MSEVDAARMLEAEVELSGSSMQLHISPAADISRRESVIIYIEF